MDPISLLMAAQAAVSAIRKGCEMLADGKAEIDKFKKTVEGGVANATAIYKEVTGIWGWLSGLFGAKPKAPAPVAKAVEAAKPSAAAKKKAKEADPEITYEEFQARSVHDICEQLKIYFEILRQLKQHCQELKDESLTSENVASSAIDRIEIEWQMQQMAVQVREAMVYTPERLGLKDLYTNFLQTYDEILEEQEFARQVQRKKERDGKWQRELLRNHRIDRTITVVVILVLVLWMWGFLLSLGWLAKTHAGLSSQ